MIPLSVAGHNYTAGSSPVVSSPPVSIFRSQTSKSNGVPAEVSIVVEGCQPTEGFEVVPAGPNERSFIYRWGVRVRHVQDPSVCGWIFLASNTCRTNLAIHVIYGGKTSRATKHLKTVHDITSAKTTIEDSRKRMCDDTVTRILCSVQTQESCERVGLLLHTLLVVYNNLPFVMGEYEESRILKAVVAKANFRAVINCRTTTHSVVELYTSAKRELLRFLSDNCLKDMKSLCMMCDFWAAIKSGTRFLGLRVYFVDADWNLNSVLLGVRHFQPLYGERDGGIRGPFKRWICRILDDFALSPSDFFGSMTDGGSDVQHMMKVNLMLAWEWCMPHLSNAATKAAFGMTSNTSASKNPEMMQLMKKITKTVYQMRSVEVMGDLYEHLARLLNVGKETKLIDYKPHRFMGLAKVMQRIVKHWEVLVLWYNERATKAERERTAPPNPFPLAEDKLLMEQLVSLMQPIVVLNEKSQADKANQVDVLLSTYKVMVTTLAAEQPLKKYDATRDNPKSYHHSTLVPLITKTRALLSAAFHSRFFSRYTDREKMRTCSYVWEMQMLLHPHVKNPDGPLSGMIKACGELVHLDQHIIERIQSVIKTTVKSKLLALMRELDPPVGRDNLERREPSSSYGAGVFLEDLSELFDIRSTAPDLTPPELVHEERIGEELERWFRDPELLQRSNDEVFESVLHFWKRQHEYGTYRFLPRVARVVFAVPVSSAQIERDFGISGQMVTTQRTSLSAQNIYMCAFLSRNL